MFVESLISPFHNLNYLIRFKLSNPDFCFTLNAKVASITGFELFFIFIFFIYLIIIFSFRWDWNRGNLLIELSKIIFSNKIVIVLYDMRLIWSISWY